MHSLRAKRRDAKPWELSLRTDQGNGTQSNSDLDISPSCSQSSCFSRTESIPLHIYKKWLFPRSLHNLPDILLILVAMSSPPEVSRRLFSSGSWGSQSQTNQSEALLSFRKSSRYPHASVGDQGTLPWPVFHQVSSLTLRYRRCSRAMILTLTTF